MEIESGLVNTVDAALQMMTVDTGVNNNHLELVVAIKCEQSDHKPTLGGNGMFFVRGSRLLTSSKKVLTERSESFLGQIGCGYEGFASSCVNHLQEQLHELRNMVPCSNRSYEHDVVLEDGCPEHNEICFKTLVLSPCKTLAKRLQGRFRRIFNEGKGLAHQTLEGLNVADPIPGKHVFTLSVKTAVSWAISTMGNATPVDATFLFL